MYECRGEFRFDPPPNIQGGVMIIEDAEWEECDACGERIILPRLSKCLETHKMIRILGAAMKPQWDKLLHKAVRN